MQSGNRLVVVIPIYKEGLTESEIISLKRVIKVLSNRDFSIVCPENLAVTNYLNYFVQAGVKVLVQRFDDNYFNSIEGYNRLMLSVEFYSRFTLWTYLIIYQLDSFIFKDDLEKWIEADYDYIGAPWPNHERALNFYKSLIYSRYKLIGLLKKTIDFNKGERVFVGNGGLSFRKVSKFKMISKILHLFFRRHLAGQINEDYIWSILVTKYFASFRVPPATIASKFALEESVEPIDLGSIESLPVACHAWEKYYPLLWKSVINKFD